MISPPSPPCPSYRGEDVTSFAYPTVFKRWPVILQQVIDDLRQNFEDRASDLCNQIAQIQVEILNRIPMPLLMDDNEPDLQHWNEALQKYFPQTTYSQASWLFAECYLYRRVWNVFRCSSEATNYDPFQIRKQASLDEALPKMISSANNLHAVMHSSSSNVTRELLLMSLWGNATDLSMFAGLTQAQMETITASFGEDKIICNDLDQICSYIQKLKHGRIDFVLDNNGFELFSDFLLADNLHRIGAATKIVFHCKAIPWFVSDTTPNDFEALFSSLENASDVPGQVNVDHLHNLVKTWRDYLTRGDWVLKPNLFWTSWWAYHHLPEVAPELFSELVLSSLVFFKGDLNYRKLVYDCHWPSTTTFREAIGKALSSKVPLVALRTNKSGSCVGLAKGKEAELVANGDADWRWSGKFAMVQFSEPGRAI